MRPMIWAADEEPAKMCDPHQMRSPGAFLTMRRHIDLQRVLSAACPA